MDLLGTVRGAADIACPVRLVSDVLREVKRRAGTGDRPDGLWIRAVGQDLNRTA